MIWNRLSVNIETFGVYFSTKIILRRIIGYIFYDNVYLEL